MRGYPACAGIDLASLAALISRSRLPRMRGDRPGSPPLHLSVRWATPHARGSTSIGCIRGLAYGGYPACAGIDLSGALSTVWNGRLPRMRGDRPGLTEPIERGIQATPHARGSTYC